MHTKDSAHSTDLKVKDSRYKLMNIFILSMKICLAGKMKYK